MPVQTILPLIPFSYQTPIHPQSSRSGSSRAQRAEAERIMALGEPDAACVGHQGTVKEGGRGKAERAIEQKLPRGGCEQIGAADDFRDSHGGIVHHNRELIGGNIVVPPNDEIAEISSGNEVLLALATIHETNDLAVRD